MKKVFFVLAGLSSLVLATPSYASFFEVCKVTAKVVSVEELSVFGTGSVSLPAYPGGTPRYTFKNLLTLEILGVEAELGSHTNCERMLDNTYRVILDQNIFEETLPSAGEELRLTRSVNNSMTQNGVAYAETWSLQ